eukprot:15459496-Alexandrium_andersonii.AAC.2
MRCRGVAASTVDWMQRDIVKGNWPGSRIIGATIGAVVNRKDKGINRILCPRHDPLPPSKL